MTPPPPGGKRLSVWFRCWHVIRRKNSWRVSVGTGSRSHVHRVFVKAKSQTPGGTFFQIWRTDVLPEGELIRCVRSDKTNIFYEHSTIHSRPQNGCLTVRYIHRGNIAPSSLTATSFTRQVSLKSSCLRLTEDFSVVLGAQRLTEVPQLFFGGRKPS